MPTSANRIDCTQINSEIKGLITIAIAMVFLINVGIFPKYGKILMLKFLKIGIASSQIDEKNGYL